jgi:hypothetical protein
LIQRRGSGCSNCKLQITRVDYPIQCIHKYLLKHIGLAPLDIDILFLTGCPSDLTINSADVWASSYANELRCVSRVYTVDCSCVVLAGAEV